MTDIAGLCERLQEGCEAARSFQTRDAARPCWRRQIVRWFVYPTDLTQAADTIERQAAEIERLQGALGEILKIAGGDIISVRVKKRAQAALTGEDK